MNNLLVTLTTILMTLLTACAPSTDTTDTSKNTNSSINDNAVNTSVKATADINAEPEFDFRGDRLIELSFDQFPSGKGKFNIYSNYEHHDPDTNIYYPDYATRVASFIAMPGQNYHLQVNDLWTYLVFEWLPMDGLSNEGYLHTVLSNSDTFSLDFNEQ
mgnify:CR=1 FL=1